MCYLGVNNVILQNYLIKAVQNKLKDRAQILIGSRVELNTWGLIKSALVDCFGDKRDLQCLEQDLFTARPHKGENFLEFGKRLQVLRSNLAQRINSNNDMPAAEKLITFIDNIENAVTFAKLNTLHHAVISLQDFENIIKSLKKLYDKEKIPKLNSIMSYYQIAGVQVTYSENRIIFAIHFPILMKPTFEYFQLFPIPINNHIIIPNDPYLLLGTNMVQQDDVICPEVENSYICPNNLKPIFNNCEISMLRESDSSKCNLIKVDVENPIIQAITNEFIIAVPTEKPIRFR